MSGYLNRLATSVVQQKPRVHPFAESSYVAIYGASARHEEAPHFAFERVSTAESHSIPGPVSTVAMSSGPSASSRHAEFAGQAGSAPPEKIPAAHLDSTAVRSASDLRRENRETLAEKISVSQEIFQPLLPQPVMPTRDVVAPRPERESVSAPEFTATPPDSQSIARHSDTSLSHAWSYKPIVLEGKNGPPVSQANPHVGTTGTRDTFVAQNPTSSRQVITPTAPARRAPTPQPADVQIHIGRIEVIAVPPPAPRAVPVPARKGLTLDEYLSGNNGRAR